MKKLINYLYRFLMSRVFMIIVIMLLQIAVVWSLVSSVMHSTFYLEYGAVLFTILNLILTVSVINKDKNPSYKMAWVVVINVLPLVGGLIYLLFANRRVEKDLTQQTVYNLAIRQGILRRNPETPDSQNEDVSTQMNYVYNNSFYPFYQNTQTKYYTSGEDCFEDMKTDLRKAKHFIFMEYFIVKPGKMYDEIRAILKQKIEEGVEVYFTYDDGGTIMGSAFRFDEDLRSIGVHVAVFSPVSVYLLLLSKTNNRDHRKIVVVDNQCGYIGGLNLADEYINVVKRFGYWKDTAIRIEGEAVKNLTVMYLQFYNATTKEDLSYERFLSLRADKMKVSSFVLPFSDSPSDDEDIGHAVHLNMISHAKKYVYIETPYLILDDSLSTALCLAAKSGVDVRIIVPHIPDKKTVFMVTRANAVPLIKAGVRVYEYTPGFIHSKNIVSDDEIGIVGTINMDFRSYYLHYECGVLLGEDPAVLHMKEDFLKTLSECQEVTWSDVENVPFPVKLCRSVLNVFAPLL